MLRRLLLTVVSFVSWGGVGFVEQLQQSLTLSSLRAAIYDGLDDGLSEAFITWKDPYYASLPYIDFPLSIQWLLPAEKQLQFCVIEEQRQLFIKEVLRALRNVGVKRTQVLEELDDTRRADKKAL